MKNIELVIPKLNQYSYEQKLESDSKTMSYNAGYDVSYFGYHYNTGCIDFPKEKCFRVLRDHGQLPDLYNVWKTAPVSGE